MLVYKFYVIFDYIMCILLVFLFFIVFIVICSLFVCVKFIVLVFYFYNMDSGIVYVFILDIVEDKYGFLWLVL